VRTLKAAAPSAARARTVLVPAAIALATLALTGCGRGDDAQSAPGLSAPARAAVIEGVRQLARDAAHGVSREGPAAWHRYFSPTPAFFMASEGQLVFSSAGSAARGIDDLTHLIRSIELRWSDDLRVDPLTADLAVMGSSWSELRTGVDGARVTDRGYFTAVAERPAARADAVRDGAAPGPPFT
jgi:hypothetical protein